MRWLAPWVVGVAVGVCLVGAPSAAAFQGPWAPAVDVSATVKFPAHGRWQPAPQVAVAPDGTTTIVWMRFNGKTDRRQDGDYIVQASTRPPGGTFGAPINLSAPGGSAYRPQVAVAAEGTTTVIWNRANGQGLVVQARTRPPGGAFGPPVDLSAADDGAYVPKLVVAADGMATAFWVANGVAQVRSRPPGGTFGPPVELAGGPAMAIADDGTTIAVWSADGVVQATWGRTLTRSAVKVKVQPFAPLSSSRRAAFSRALGTYAAFLGREPQLSFIDAD